MRNKARSRIKVLRKGEPVEPQSTHIRQDQANRLKASRPPTVIITQPEDRVKLSSRTATEIYSAGRMIQCAGCKEKSPTKRMYRYRQSSRGIVILCERCDESAEVRSFYKLDALDKRRKEFKVE